MSWTEQQVQDLRSRWLSGGSLRGIAAEFGRSPGAISGKLRRLGLLRIKRVGLSVHQSGAFERGKTDEHREDMEAAISAAKAVNQYWKARGHDPEADAVFKDGCWQVVSNLVNGMPRRRAA